MGARLRSSLRHSQGAGLERARTGPRHPVRHRLAGRAAAAPIGRWRRRARLHPAAVDADPARPAGKARDRFDGRDQRSHGARRQRGQPLGRLRLRARQRRRRAMLRLREDDPWPPNASSVRARPGSSASSASCCARARPGTAPPRRSRGAWPPEPASPARPRPSAPPASPRRHAPCARPHRAPSPRRAAPARGSANP